MLFRSAHDDAPHREEHHNLCHNRHGERTRATLSEEGQHDGWTEEAQVTHGCRNGMRTGNGKVLSAESERHEKHQPENDAARQEVTTVEGQIEERPIG